MNWLEVAVSAGLAESVTVTAKVAVASVVGVPDSTPVVESRLSQLGSVDPLATLQVSEPVPPVAVKVTEYGVFSGANGSGEVVVTDNGVAALAVVTPIPATVPVITPMTRSVAVMAAKNRRAEPPVK